jgi:hypothetical protein
MPTVTRSPAVLARPFALRPRAAGAFALVLAVVAVPARAEPLPLPAADQARVDQAIERGVTFLKKAQGPQGSWAGARDKHFLGYAALPGLTLLECGVPATDPAVRRAAAFVRRAAPRNDATYEIALSILFLDRLGDPQDRPLIQALAVRLLAGQDVTGGWSYRCGSVSKKNQEEIVNLLRKVGPPGKAPGLGLPVGKPGGGPGQAVKKPQAPDGKPVGKRPNGPPATGPAGGAPASPAGTPVGTEKSAGDTASTLQPTRSAPATVPVERGPGVKAGGAAPGASIKAGAAGAPEGEVVIPKNLRALAVFQDRNPLFGGGKARQFAGRERTDNSNTQFALLALWVAQRHDVPLQRTLGLVARRFEKSQNADGSWSYLFFYGGGIVSRPTMTCVGLLGLAVGHGLEPAGAGKVPQDPQIVNGFAALSMNIGQPVGAFLPVPQQDLYFLWSVERAAMLYDLPTIGGKDWYRWGAENLVANQQPLGNWDKGGYHGAARPLDTSLALLFLKRVNLAKDLTARLPFNKKELDKTITLKAGSLPPPSPGDTPTPPARNKR